MGEARINSFFQNRPATGGTILKQSFFFNENIPKKTDLLIGHNPEHFGTAIRASTGHRSALGAAFALKRCFVGIFHHSLGLALDAICFNLIHNLKLILISVVYLI